MNLAEKFSKFIEKDSKFKEVLEIISENSLGNNWLIGGALYQNLAYLLYGTKHDVVDFDFIIEKPVENIILPKGWEFKLNSFGNPKLIGKNTKIDYVPLNSIVHTIRNNLEATIENFLLRTPLTIHSIAYHLETQTIEGEAGLKALETKTVGSNDLEELRFHCQRYNITIEEAIKKEAEKLNFRPIY